MMKKPDAPSRRRRRTAVALAAAACAATLSALSLPSRADVPAMLDPNLQVTTVLNTGLTQPIGIVFLGSVNDYLVLEKASGQVKRVINGVAPGHAGARPGGELELRARPVEHGAAPEFPGDTLRLHPLDREPHRGRLDRRASGAAARQSGRSLHLERRRTLTLDRNLDHAARPPDRQRRRARPSRARTTAPRTATTTAA